MQCVLNVSLEMFFETIVMLNSILIRSFSHGCASIPCERIGLERWF